MTQENANSQLPAAPSAIQRVERVDSLPMLSSGMGEPPMQVGPHGPNLLHVLWRRRLIVLLSILVAVLGGGVYLYLATPIYSSSSRVYVQDSTPKIMSADDSAGRHSTNLSTECQIIMSGPILAKALDAPNIKGLRTFAGDTSAFSALASDLTVAPGKNDDLITVSFESPYAEDTAQVVNAVVDAYVAYKSSSKRSSAAEVLKVLQKEKVKRDGDLEESLKEMLDFRQKHGELGFQGEKGNIVIQRLDRLSSALTDAELELVQAHSMYESVLSVIDPNLPKAWRTALIAREAILTAASAPASAPADVPDFEVPVPLPKGAAAKINQFWDAKSQSAGSVYISTQDDEAILRSELNGLRVQRQSLDLSYSQGHFAIDRIDKRIAEVEQLIAAQQDVKANSRLAAVRQQYKAAEMKARSVRADYERQMQAALKLNGVLSEYAKLDYQCNGLKRLVEQLDVRIKELNVTEDVGAMNISVLEPASRPVTPIKPKKVQVAGMATALGILLGIGLAMLRSWTDRRVTSADEVGGILGVPVMGTLPRIKGRRETERMGRNVLDNPSSITAEAYRGIRTALRFSQRSLRAKTILVTSPLPQDGKSTFTSNLAFSMAQAGQRVLIVDADLRQPKQHSILSLGNDVGLANVLAGEVSAEQAIQPFDSKPVHILPAGRTLEHSYEMLNSKGMADLLQELAELYDTILIDSPPLMSVTDPLVLAAICDVTILVVRAGWSDRRAAEQAREGLFSVGARVIGTVVTGIKGNSGRYHRYYHQYYAAKENADPQDGDKEAAAKQQSDGK